MDAPGGVMIFVGTAFLAGWEYFCDVVRDGVCNGECLSCGDVAISSRGGPCAKFSINSLASISLLELK